MIFGIRTVELHPIVVHFPIALLLTSVVLDFVALAMRRWSIAEASTWPLALGTVGALAAGVTGQISEKQANLSSVGSILSMHQAFAFATGLVFAGLLAVRLAWLTPRILGVMPRLAEVDRQLRALAPRLYAGAPPRLMVGMYLAASVFGAVLLAITGYLGGVMVYEHGVGTPTGILMLWRLA